MIAKVRTGKSFIKLNQYNYREGELENHRDPHRVGGNVIGDDPWTLTDEFRSFAAANPRVVNPVWHASLRTPESERLTDDQWNQASKRFLQEMGFLQEGSDGFQPKDAPYVALRHAEDHIHIVACRVRFDGSCINVYRDRYRSHEATRAVEAELGLSSPHPSQDTLSTVTKSERESALRRKQVPERARIREGAISARDQSNGTIRDFESKLSAAGIQFKANVATTGRMNGYSFSLPEWKDAAGEQIWIAASKVSRELRWKELSRDLEANSLNQTGKAIERKGTRMSMSERPDDNAAARWWRHKVDREADHEHQVKTQSHWAAFNEELGKQEAEILDARRRKPTQNREPEAQLKNLFPPTRLYDPPAMDEFTGDQKSSYGESGPPPGEGAPLRDLPNEIDLPYEPQPQSEVGRILSDLGGERDRSPGWERD